jgi:hypothetical protein
VTRRVSRLAFGIALTVNLLVLYWPRQVSDGGPPYADKLVHAAIFAAVASTGLRAGLPARWLLGCLAAHAVTSEMVQHWLLPDRSGDARDVLADLVGMTVGAVVGVVAGRSGGSWLHERAGPGPGADRAPARRDAGAG